MLSEVTLNIPPFRGGRDQLNAEETDEMARIAAVRILVNWAIGWIKNYHIQDGNCHNDTSDESSIHSLQLFDQFFTTTCTTKWS